MGYLQATRFVAFSLALMVSLSVSAQIAPPPTPDKTPEEAPQPSISKPPVLIEFVEAVYPEEAFNNGETSVVRLLFDIGIDGKTSNISIVESGGEMFDMAAIKAAEQFLFSPAEADGQPLPVRITYVYTFSLKTAPPPAKEARDPILSIEGQILAKGTRRVLGGVAVEIPALDLRDISDEEGRFRFFDIPPGGIELLVPKGRYLELVEPISIPEDKAAEVTLRLEKNPYADFVTIIESEYDEPVRRVLEIQEIQKIPGTSGDALKAILNLPSVARPPGGSGLLIVRGSNPEDTAFRLDELFIPQLYHFGGIYSVINTDLLDNIEFYPGGFDTLQGNATAGLVRANLKDGPTDKWGGYFDINIFHAAGFAEGPVWEDGSLSMAFRRSYIDVILPAILPEDTLSFNTAPVYYDYQVKLDQELNDTNKLRVFLYGSDDQLELLLDKVSDDDPAIRGGIETHSYFHFALLRLETDINDELKLVSSMNGGKQLLSFQLANILDFNINLWRMGWREDFTWTPSPEFTLDFGMDVTYEWGDIDITAPMPPKEGKPGQPLSEQEIFSTQDKGIFGDRAFYLQGRWKPIDELSMTGGVRVDWFGAEYKAVTVDPRFNFVWEIVDGTELKGAVGMYHRRPNFDELDVLFGNPDLDPEESIQYSLGVRQEFFEGFSIDLQGFYKTQNNLVSPVEDPLETPRYDNGGEGRVYGGELLIRQAFGSYVWGWVSYTLSRAERRDEPDEAFRLFDYDQTHILTVVASGKFPWGLELGIRFRYVTGNPETPVERAVFDTDTGIYSPVYGEVNSIRVPDFLQLDVRLDKEWLFDTWRLLTYIEVQNATNRKNPEGLMYNYDYSENDTVNGLPIIPGFGIKGIF